MSGEEGDGTSKGAGCLWTVCLSAFSQVLMSFSSMHCECACVSVGGGYKTSEVEVEGGVL